MPEYSRSFQRTLWNVLSNFAASGEVARSGAATRAFETPRPVPVLNQSCASAGYAANRTPTAIKHVINAAFILMRLYPSTAQLLPSIIEIKFHSNAGSRVPGWQSHHRAGLLDGAHRR